MYNTMTACLYFYNLKFDIFDTIVFTASLEEAVNSIDFSHSNRKTWTTTIKLTGRSGHSSHLCPVSTNPIASQLVKNGAHKTRDHEPVNKGVSNLRKVPTPKGDSITGPFTPE